MVVTQKSKWDDVGTEIPTGQAKYEASKQPIAEYDNWINYNLAKDIENIIADVIDKYAEMFKKDGSIAMTGDLNIGGHWLVGSIRGQDPTEFISIKGDDGAYTSQIKIYGLAAPSSLPGKIDFLMRDDGGSWRHPLEIERSSSPKVEMQYGVKADLVEELTPNYGVTIDSCLIKDGYPHIPNHTPSSASDTGTEGQVCYDANYIYMCIATNTWKRVAISTW